MNGRSFKSMLRAAHRAVSSSRVTRSSSALYRTAHDSSGIPAAGVEYYLPLFFEQTATVFDYFGERSTVVLHGELEPAFQRFWQDTKDRLRLVHGDPERPVLPPEALFLSAEQFYSKANALARSG